MRVCVCARVCARVCVLMHDQNSLVILFGMQCRVVCAHNSLACRLVFGPPPSKGFKGHVSCLEELRATDGALADNC